MKLQSKKNLRQRMNRLHLSINNIVDYSVAIEHTGSLKKGNGEPKTRKDGSYDLDINFVIKSNVSPKVIREDILHAIKRNLREHETIEELKRVIRINVEKGGVKYNFDIAIKKYGTEEIIINNVGGFTWGK